MVKKIWILIKELLNTFDEVLRWIWYMIIAGIVPIALPVIAKKLLGISIDFKALIPDYYLISYAIFVNICSYRLENANKKNKAFERFHSIAVMFAVVTLFAYYVMFYDGFINPVIRALIEKNPELQTTFIRVITTGWIIMAVITIILYIWEIRKQSKAMVEADTPIVSMEQDIVAEKNESKDANWVNLKYESKDIDEKGSNDEVG